MKRIALFLLTNLGVMLVLGLVVSVLGLNRFLLANGLSVTGLLGFSPVMSFSGAFISLLISKPMAKWTAGVRMPEVGIYEGTPNAFATGAFKNSALIAVSTGLAQSMPPDEVEAVVSHEVAHAANGDMVTMTLIQGVMNTFVVLLSRVIGYVVDKVVLRNQNEGPGIGYFVTTVVMDIRFGVVAALIVAWFSRQREFRVDAGAANLLGSRQPMINALARRGSVDPGDMPKAIQAMGISARPSGLIALLSSHPPMAQRIARLKQAA